jgi:hypothetical protein
LENIYLDTFDAEDERKYNKCKELYENKLDELTALEVQSGSTTKLQKAGIDLLEKVAIKGLAEQYFDFDESKAKGVWENYVGEIGNNLAVEWLVAMSDSLFKDDEVEENSFLALSRKKAEERANNRKKALKK